MSWIVNWNGKEYDIDPAEFTGLELKLIKERTGLGYAKLIEAVAAEQDGEAMCALFWTVDRRTQPDLKFTDYPGPPLRVVLEHLDGLNAAIEAMGKAMKIPAKTPTTETNGSHGSQSSIPPSETEASTTS